MKLSCWKCTILAVCLLLLGLGAAPSYAGFADGMAPAITEAQTEPDPNQARPVTDGKASDVSPVFVTPYKLGVGSHRHFWGHYVEKVRANAAYQKAYPWPNFKLAMCDMAGLVDCTEAALRKLPRGLAIMVPSLTPTEFVFAPVGAPVPAMLELEPVAENPRLQRVVPPSEVLVVAPSEESILAAAKERAAVASESENRFWLLVAASVAAILLLVAFFVSWMRNASLKHTNAYLSEQNASLEKDAAALRAEVVGMRESMCPACRKPLVRVPDNVPVVDMSEISLGMSAGPEMQASSEAEVALYKEEFDRMRGIEPKAA